MLDGQGLEQLMLFLHKRFLKVAETVTFTFWSFYLYPFF
jgi:hypothetical protein